MCHIFSSCFVSQLAKHMEKCNSKPQPLPEYIKENVNVIDSNDEEFKVNLGTLTDDELLAIISRVSKIHSGGCETVTCWEFQHFFLPSPSQRTPITNSIFIHVPIDFVGELPISVGRHPVLESTLASLTESRGSWRHVFQSSSILHNMAQVGVLTSGKSRSTYVEFGSGRGIYSFNFNIFSFPKRYLHNRSRHDLVCNLVFLLYV